VAVAGRRLVSRRRCRKRSFAVPFHHPGPVGEAQIARLETEFGQKLPRLYRSWLAEHNGGIPAELAGIPGYFVLPDLPAPTFVA
jgi:hypothetical protein